MNADHISPDRPPSGSNSRDESSDAPLFASNSGGRSSTPSGSEFAQHWLLDPTVTFLNHGSFGASPRAILEKQQELRERLEREPLTFFVRKMEGMLDEARSVLGDFLGADAQDLAFIPNTTHGVNAVLRSLAFEPGDELLTTDHEYNACRTALDFVASRSGARVVAARVPFPLDDDAQVVDALLSVVTVRTRLALIDQITSPTALVLPVERLVSELAARGVPTLIDGAHTPGMLPLNLNRLGADYFVGNCHKWLCAPKGAAFLYVRRERQEQIRPLAISHGANDPREDRSRFLKEFDWTGTADPTAYLSVPTAIRFMESLLPGGWPELMARNRRLASDARDLLSRALSLSPPCPAEMLGSMAALPLPEDPEAEPPQIIGIDPLTEQLFDRYRIEAPIILFPPGPHRLLRVSAQIYNSIDQYQRLAAALAELG